MRTRSTILALAMLTLLISSAAWAANGNQLTGIGPIQSSMSGAGVAAPLDSTTIILNPAGMVRVPDRFDFSVEAAFPIAHMNTSAAPIGNAAAGNQGNDIELFPLPAISATFGLMEDRVALGVGFFNTGGNEFNYKQSRVNPALTGNVYDRYVDFKIFKVVGAGSYAILENLSLGLGIHANFASFGTDFALPTAGFAETAGRARNDYSPGIGAALGMLYSPLPELSLGFCYTSRQFFRKFKKYSDVTDNNPDSPRQIKVGIAGKPFDIWLLALDFHWINWSGVPLYGNSPTDGGLGWKDQFIFDFGTQVRLGKHFRFRAGYGWGKSPISSDVVFVNAISPTITEHNIGVGFSVDINEHWAINAAYAYNVKNSLTQALTADPYGQGGVGTTVDMTGHAGTLGLSYSWKGNDEGTAMGRTQSLQESSTAGR